MKPSDWEIISTPSQKITCTYNRKWFSEPQVEHVEDEILFFSGLEKVNETRILQCLQSGWIEVPEISNLKFKIIN